MAQPKQGQYGVIHEQGFLTQGLGFNPINEGQEEQEQKENKEKEDDK